MAAFPDGALWFDTLDTVAHSGSDCSNLLSEEAATAAAAMAQIIGAIYSFKQQQRTWAVVRVKVMLDVLRPSASKLSPSTSASFCRCVSSVLSRLLSQERCRNRACVLLASLKPEPTTAFHT